MARKIILIVFALLITGSTVWFVRNWAGSQKPATVETAAVEVQPVSQNVKILVAATDLPAGTLVQEQHLKWQAWPEDDDIEDMYIVEKARPLDDFIGTVVRQGIVAGEPITDARMVKPGQSGFLAAVLNPGKRAVSIPVDITSGIAGFVFPGDRVDVILTHSLVAESEVEGETSAARRASETILTDVRVVAMDQSTNDQEQEASVRRVATLEVSPKGAEIIAVAKELGQLTLSLRALARIEDEEKSKDGQVAFKAERGRGHTWDSEASRLITGGSPRMGIPTTVINVVRAGEAKQKLFD
ncbi:Flp pilus assembly protein CpaB [Sneathiella chungangensis]|uniref:Flp pilus assembly protein CpaB n=1 Tax=Sneathiella chungangensis TaxID=1418234 RepID=A0A845MH66_9PROT|nr:Flp pilus assembly protein CpaB [Sneathiella chungangensis]MZR22354.1 Flp pilus assembly protein CpaB [Sneathiella chungangensis]